MKTQWFVYIIETQKKKLYTGITTDIERRFEEHKSQKKGAKYFKMDRPLKVVFRELHPNRSSALKREAQIKAMNKNKKIELIKGLTV